MGSVLGGSMTFVRGIGATEPLLSIDSSVGSYICGVPRRFGIDLKINY